MAADARDAVSPWPAPAEQARRVRVEDQGEGGPVGAVEVSSTCSGFVVEPDLGLPATFRVRVGPSTDPGCMLVFRAPGYVPTAVRREDLASGETIVRLQRAGVVRGRVLADDGSPCGGAEVTLGGLSVVADEEGAFEATPLPLDTAMVLDVRCARGHIENRERITLTRDRPERWVDLRLATGFTLVVEVADERGAPLPMARVTIQSTDGRPPFVRLDGATDEAGEHLVRGLRAATYLAAAALEGHDSSHAGDIVVGPDAPVERRRIVLPRGGTHWIGGLVTDTRGRPIPGIVATFAADPSRKTTTDEDGRFRFVDLTRLDVPLGFPKPRLARGVRVRLEGPSWSSPARTVPWDQEARLVVAARAAVVGRVVGPDGKPVGRLSVQFAPDLEDRATIDDATEVPRQGAEHFTFGASGTVRGKDLMAVPGRLILQEASGRWRPKEIPLDLSAGGTVDFGEVALEAGATLTGEVRTPTGAAALPWGSAACLLGDDLAVRAAAPVVRGGFAFGAAPAGRWVLWIVAEGWAAEPREIVLADGATERIDVDLRRLLPLRVQVAGTAPDDFLGRVRPLGAGSGVFTWRTAGIEERGLLRRVRVDASPAEAAATEGVIQFEGLPEGEYEVELTDATGQSLSVRHRVDPEHEVLHLDWPER